MGGRAFGARWEYSRDVEMLVPLFRRSMGWPSPRDIMTEETSWDFGSARIRSPTGPASALRHYGDDKGGLQRLGTDRCSSGTPHSADERCRGGGEAAVVAQICTVPDINEEPDR